MESSITNARHDAVGVGFKPALVRVLRRFVMNTTLANGLSRDPRATTNQSGYSLPRHRSFGCRRDELSILRHDAGLVARRRWRPLPEPCLHFLFGNFNIQTPRFDIENDRIAVAHRGNRPAMGSFRRDMSRHQPMSRARK